MDKEYAVAYMEDFLNAYVATQIRTLREDRNLSQEKLAEIVGMRQSRISLMESINYGSWSITSLRRLAAAFDVTLRVSFETFSSAISEVSSFARDKLQRESREEDLKAIGLKEWLESLDLATEAELLEMKMSALASFKVADQSNVQAMATASTTPVWQLSRPPMSAWDSALRAPGRARPLQSARDYAMGAMQ
jgi:transcriptional regulator with XRE-family HTH domain